MIYSNVKAVEFDFGLGSARNRELNRFFEIAGNREGIVVVPTKWMDAEIHGQFQNRTISKIERHFNTRIFHDSTIAGRRMLQLYDGTHKFYFQTFNEPPPVALWESPESFAGSGPSGDGDDRNYIFPACCGCVAIPFDAATTQVQSDALAMIKIHGAIAERAAQRRGSGSSQCDIMDCDRDSSHWDSVCEEIRRLNRQ